MPLNKLLHIIYDQGRYDLAIDYSGLSQVSLAKADKLWVEEVIAVWVIEFCLTLLGHHATVGL